MFYEGFREKIKKIKIEDVNEVEKFHLNFFKSFVWFMLAMCLLIIGTMALYMNLQKGNMIGMIFGLLILASAIMFFYMIFEYRVKIDMKESLLKYKKIIMKFENIDSVTLRNMIAPGTKKFQICLDIITKDKMRFILPLIMNKRERFVGIVKKIIERNFYIEEN